MFMSQGCRSVGVGFLPRRERHVEPLLDDDGAPLQRLTCAEAVEVPAYPAADSLVQPIAHGHGLPRLLVLGPRRLELVELQETLELVEAVLIGKQRLVESAELGMRVE